MAELKTLSPRKWVANFGGVAPTLDTTDGVYVGDLAVDSSTTPNATWRCMVNTDSAPKWRRHVGGWEDLQVPGLAIKAGVVAPDLIGFAGSASLQVYGFNGGGTSPIEEILFTVQMPHSWLLGSDIYPHVHFTPVDANSGTVKWYLEYTFAEINAAFPGTSTIATSAVAVAGVAWQHQLASFSAITPSSSQDGISAIFAGRLYRDPGQDTYASDAAFLGFDIHYQSDGLGSDAEASKS